MNSVEHPTTKPRFAVAVIGGAAASSLGLIQSVLPTVINAQIEFFSDRESVLMAAKMWPGKFLLFTNFPADLDRSLSYADSKNFLKELISICPEAHVHVFTNAGIKILTDQEVLELLPRYQISIERPWNWPNYLGGLTDFLVRRVVESFPDTSRESLLLPDSLNYLNKNPQPHHELMKEMGMNADPVSDKPENPNVDIESYRLWQRSNKIFAAQKYRDISGD